MKMYKLFFFLLLVAVASMNTTLGQQKAMSFDGVNDYISLNALNGGLISNNTHFTIEFWMKAKSIDQNNAFSTVFSVGQQGVANKLVIEIDGSGHPEGHISIYGDENINPQPLIWESNFAVANDTCQHIAFSYDGVNNVMKLYVNGTLVATEPMIINITSTDQIAFGKLLSGFGPENHFKGLISDIRFFDYVRSDMEIFSNMYTSYNGNESGLFGLYKFNEGVSNGNNAAISSAVDSSPSGANGSYQGFSMSGTSSNFVNSPCVANYSVLTGVMSQTINHICNGNACSYDGPSILINELMISPTSGDGSISSQVGTALNTQRGEWIELYNPNICEPVDISCYYLGNYTYEGTGGFIIPAGTVVPAGGFCILRGANAPSVPPQRLVANGGNVIEIVFPPYINSEGNCTNGTRIWFPNAGGWFAFYDASGVPQDAVAWGPSNVSDRAGNPCVPTRSGCNPAQTLASYNQIPADRKAVASSIDGGTHMGQSIRRAVDGGAWAGAGSPTYANCNATCVQLGVSTCDGTATIVVEGGTPPYTYQWNDSQGQLTATATGLCAGTYEVNVSDAIGNTKTFTVEIENFVPEVDLTIQQSICVNNPAINAQVSPVPQGDATGVLTGNGVTGFSFDPATATVGTHTLTYDYTDEHGCQNQASAQIIVNGLPTLSWNISPSYCIPGQDHQLTLTPSGGTLNGPGMSGSTFSANNAGAGTHTVSYTYTDVNSCTNMIQTDVVIHQTIMADINPPAYLCVNDDTYVLTGNLNNTSMTINGQDVSSGIHPGILGVGNYTINYSGVDANNCPSSTTAPIEIKALPVLTINHPATICSNIPQTPVNVNPTGGTLTGDLLSGMNILTAGGTSNIDYHLTYVYADAFGCENTQTSTFRLIDAIEPTINYTTDCFFHANIVENYNAFASVNWVTSGIVSGTGGYYTITFPDEGEYEIGIETVDMNGCPSAAMILADIPMGLRLPDYQVPNVITVNNDGVNDELEMHAMFDHCIEYEIVIIDRWGNHVFTATKDNRFKGYSKSGAELPHGVYFYDVISTQVDYKDEMYKPYKSGFITIVK